jgi:serine/threonine-protein kinase
MALIMASPAVTNSATTSAPGSSHDIGPGVVIADRYRIDELITKGSEGEIYLAEQVALRRKVAVKVLHAGRPNLPDQVTRFEREGLVAAGIENPNIAGALEVGRLPDDSVFFVVEFVPGRSLRSELSTGPLSIERSLHIAKQVASALADTHEIGIVHRDLKPENLMLLRRGDDLDFVKVLDFGLPHESVATKPGSKADFLLGTPGYMPPEQALGQPVDGRADLYSLGVVLFEMLAGVRLFENASGILAKQLAGHVPTFAERAPAVQVPPELEKLVKRLLAPSAAERFTSADHLIEALDAAGARTSAPPAIPARASVPPAAPARSISDKPAAKSSAPPPMNLRRTHAGPPVLADRLPAFEPPRPKASGAAPASTPFDDANIPTNVALPKVTALPPLAPLPAVSAATAPPPARSAAGAAANAVGAPATSVGTATVRARAAQFASRARSYADPLRKRLQGRQGLLLGGAATAAALGAALVAFLVLRPSKIESATERHPSTASLASSSHVDVAPSPRQAPAGPMAGSVAQPIKASDEASVFLSLAGDYVRERRDVEAVQLISRVLVRQPELKDDARIATLLARTVRSDMTQASDDSLSLLTGAMGEKGAELMYSLALEPTLRDSLRRRVETWLASKDFDRVSSASLYSAVKLRNAKTCDQKHALLTLAAEVGGKQTLELMRDLDAHTICGASDLKNCYPCLAADSRIKDSISRLEKRLGK